MCLLGGGALLELISLKLSYSMFANSFPPSAFTVVTYILGTSMVEYVFVLREDFM